MQTSSEKSDREINLENAAELVDTFVQEELDSLAAYPEDRFEGRGIVIAAGGFRFQVCAWVCLKMLRHVGCELPVECWYLGPKERNVDWERLVRPLGATCIDAYAVRERYPHARLHGWELKPYAITHSRFAEVLYIDADNVPVVDPTFLFDTPEYREHGAIFWPDFGRLSPQRKAWKVFGNISYRDEPEFESGQIALSKRRCWKCLMLCHWYMQNSNNFFFHHVHGDKEVFHLAWRKLDQSYAMPPHDIKALTGVMCQHDFDGRRIFQHRNLRKWRLDQNPETPGFLYEPECREYLAELARKWNPVARRLRDLPVEDRRAMEEAVGRYEYVRVGYDRRTMFLRPYGLIGQGAATCETLWYCEGEHLILLADDSQVTARLTRHDSDVWHGRWERHERMPVVLRRIDPC